MAAGGPDHAHGLPSMTESRGSRLALTLEHTHGLIDLGPQLCLGLQEDQQLAVVHLEHHACDLA
eukprot:CAMPEP_0183543078 /NCGR_PEP_ID=MMETSP0371-20130417/43190_1 /TAXON_ID=268820 /ORGANISM="Peridinium aciculiferum, Strain PAER-2" /LENGTH=63 /DNA_ID=CAMNT_0025744467 /DNA_START=30 /DNA_END=218 /DNA_ORIENTATION=-